MEFINSALKRQIRDTYLGALYYAMETGKRGWHKTYYKEHLIEIYVNGDTFKKHEQEVNVWSKKDSSIMLENLSDYLSDFVEDMYAYYFDEFYEQIERSADFERQHRNYLETHFRYL